MNSRKIYLSFPMHNSDTLFDDVRDACFRSNVKVELEYHRRGSDNYRPTILEGCDELVFSTLNNSFSGHVSDLPIGVRKEYLRAIDRNMRIWLAYKTADGTIRLYRVNASRSIFNGIGGTSDEYYKYGTVVHVEAPNVKIPYEEMKTVKKLTSIETDVRRGVFFNL